MCDLSDIAGLNLFSVSKSSSLFYRITLNIRQVSNYEGTAIV